MLRLVTDVEVTPAALAPSVSLIDEVVRDGARRMLAAALEAEVAAYIAAHADQLDERGRRLVVRNGHAVARQVLTSAGAVEVHAPRVNGSDGSIWPRDVGLTWPHLGPTASDGEEFDGSPSRC